MKILFIAGQSIKSNSSVTMMNVAYIKGLVEAGNQVKVITSKLPENHIAIDEGFELPKDVIVDEYNISASFNALSSKKRNSRFKYIKSKLRKLYRYFSIYGSQKAWINNAEHYNDEEYYDLMVSSSDPKHSHLFAERLIKGKRVKYGKWVQVWGDPLYLDITRKTTLFKKRLYREEERLIRDADKVIYVSPFTAKKQKELFPQFEEKIDYILIPYFNIDTSLPKRDNVKFGYFGDYHSKVRNLVPMYEAAIEAGIEFVVRGNSDKPLNSIKNIDVDSRIPIKELNQIEKNTDVFIHLSNLKGTQIPAKVYYYSGTRKPILFILDGDSKPIKDFFDKYNRFIFCENNKEDIVNAIEKIRNSKLSADQVRILSEFSPISIAEDFLFKVEG